MSQPTPHPSAPGFRRSRCTQAVILALTALPLAAQAQDAVQRVEVTGSSIKRIEGETALPVTIIKREDIDKSGVTTAAELLKTISANTAPLSDGASITDGVSGQRGFNGANLRGLGVSSTLVLLNGRRLANFATPGDNVGVDLNNIPAGAIQRVEVLKDGASAIYGTDAIGGVVNFITRKDYQGMDFGASLADTQHDGADKTTATISFGHGSLANDGFNFFAVLDAQQLGSLRSSQRDFIKERPLATTLPALMSSNTYPANVDISSAQRDKLKAAGLLPATTSSRRFNPGNPACNPPGTVFAPAGPGGSLGCSYDYMQDTEIYPESDKLGFLARGTFKLGENAQAYAEYMQTEAKSLYRLSPDPERIRRLPTSILPEPYRSVLAGTGTIDIRYRMKEGGNRTSEVTSEGQRLVLGVSGSAGAWEYDTALSRAENRAVDKYVDGYSLYNEFVAGIKAGLINPFGPSSQAGRDLIDSLRVNDEARQSKGVTTAIDAKFTRTLGSLAGGDIGLALGAEVRKEETRFTPSELLLSNNIFGDRSSGSEELLATRDERTVRGIYAEINAPFSKQLEMQFALRHDRYSEVGSTTNPKVGVRWQPQKDLLVRTSLGTGFRAPSLHDLNAPTIYGSASSFLTDPYCVAQDLDSIDGCTDQWAVERRSNPDLKPEKSLQFTLGTVFEPVRGTSFAIDYWRIDKKDLISTMGEEIIVNNPDRFNDTLIIRDGDGFIDYLVLQKANQGKLKTSGIDFDLSWRGAQTGMGRFGLGLAATYILKYERQFGADQPFVSNLGRFLNDQVVQRWRHRLSLDWDYGALGLTLSNQYSSSYRDQNTTYDPVANELLPKRDVKAYSLWDLTGKYAFSKNLTLRGGVLNLLDTDPPFSNQAYYFLATYDPTYTDPRGRSYYLSLQYKFR